MTSLDDATRDAVLCLTAGRVTIAQIAKDQGRSSRTVRYYLDGKHVPYVKIFDVRYYAVADVRAALISAVHNQPAKRRGRPSGRSF